MSTGSRWQLTQTWPKRWLEHWPGWPQGPCQQGPCGPTWQLGWQASPKPAEVSGSWAAGGVIRRMVAKAVANVFNKDLKAAAGPQQYGLDKDGTGKLHRKITTLAAVRPGVAVMSLDCADAFSTIRRSAVAQAVERESCQSLPLWRSDGSRARCFTSLGQVVGETVNWFSRCWDWTRAVRSAQGCMH